ncbi:transmembrane and coiled-coil domains protein 2 isoform X3 [Macrosteles quadrilineatus]|uniref:transmembrane and coiled-coil domains protein 2 isoform X3 n=1 Tax=Macrosteles quadrilineatus TaxID=74068 RepID=UPI0023E11FDB|nr:transmembrane and coiled-coil domains protein 2 isoform X3 [Macrosteles quadrilineatus]
MDSLHVVSNSSKHSSRSPSPCRPPSKPHAGPHLVDGGMSRCKSPVTRHERGGSNDAVMIRPDTSSNHGSDEPPPNDQDVEFYLQSASFISNGSNELTEDYDGDDKTRAAIEQIHCKISKTKDQIRGEQTARDDNVDEYLKLASNAGKEQLPRIKAVFEKKNQKSAQTISQLQKKLESYSKKLRELEQHGAHGHHHHRQPREMLRDMGQGLKHVGGNIRDGISGFSGSVMSKPREFAHLIRNKFGSADNINSMSRNGETDGEEGGERERGHHGSATLPGNCSLGSTHSATGLKFQSEDGSECSSVTSESVPGAHTTSPHSMSNPASNNPTQDILLAEVRRNKQEIERLKDKMEAFKQAVHKEVTYLNSALAEERFRSERLEEQVNDLTELHQNEVENLKTAISDMEEKVQYQSEERLRDIHEMLECCQTKISKMEHQQAQHQQYLTLEGLDNSSARALVVKCINVLLTVLQVILLLVATAAGILMPFLRTRLRCLTTVGLLVVAVVVMKQWPELMDITKLVVAARLTVSEHWTSSTPWVS